MSSLPIRKICSLFLASLMFMSCSTGFAESLTIWQPAEEAQEETNEVVEYTVEEKLFEPLDFGDFSLALDPSIVGNVAEKKDNEVYLALFPDYSREGFHNNLVASWWEKGGDLSDVDASAYSMAYLLDTRDDLEKQKIHASNPELLDARIVLLDGVPAVLSSFRFDVDYRDLGQDLQQPLFVKSLLVSREEGGTWQFVATADTEEAMKQYYDPILQSFSWKEEEPNPVLDQTAGLLQMPQ